VATTNNWFLVLDQGTNTWASISVEEISPSADKVCTYDVYNTQSVLKDCATVVYNVSSSTSQISGGGVFPFDDATQDVVCTYNVLQQSVTKDITATYSSRQGTDRQLSLSYNVYGIVETDLELIYDVDGKVECITPEFLYNIFVDVEQDIEVTYDVIFGVLCSLNVTYAIQSSPLTATNTVQVDYRVIAARTLDSTVTYHVFNTTEKDQEIIYTVLEETARNSDAVVYNIAVPVITDVDVNYVIGSAFNAQSDKLYQYNILATMLPAPNLIGLTLQEAKTVLQRNNIPIGDIIYTA